MIRVDKVHLIQTAIQTGKERGMVARDQELARMVTERAISLENALDRCTSSQELNRVLNAR